MKIINNNHKNEIQRCSESELLVRVDCFIGPFAKYEVQRMINHTTVWHETKSLGIGVRKFLEKYVGGFDGGPEQGGSPSVF